MLEGPYSQRDHRWLHPRCRHLVAWCPCSKQSQDLLRQSAEVAGVGRPVSFGALAVPVSPAQLGDEILGVTFDREGSPGAAVLGRRVEVAVALALAGVVVERSKSALRRPQARRTSCFRVSLWR